MNAVDWVDGKFRFIDQTLLPQQEGWVDTDDLTVVGEAIRTLRVRGAPAIGVAAAFGLLLALHPGTFPDVPDLRRRLRRALAYLARTRPTAVNLFMPLTGCVESWSVTPGRARLSSTPTLSGSARHSA